MQTIDQMVREILNARTLGEIQMVLDRAGFRPNLLDSSRRKLQRAADQRYTELFKEKHA